MGGDGPVVRCPVLAEGNESLESRPGPSSASTVFLRALKTFSAAWTQTAPDSTRRRWCWGQLFSPLVSGHICGIRHCGPVRREVSLLQSASLLPGLSPENVPAMKTVAVLPAVEQHIIWLPAALGPQGPPWQGPGVLRQRFSISRSVVNPSKSS